MSTIIKPCPFCGGSDIDEAFVRSYKSGDQSQPIIAAGCHSCGASGPDTNVPDHSTGYKESINKWNDRAEVERLQARVAELVAVAVSVRDDLLLRSEIDSDGTRCVNLSASKWNSFCDVIDENNSGAFILRRQAEAVESAMENEMAEFRLHNGTSRSGCFAKDLAAYAQRLRNKADMESEQ